MLDLKGLWIPIEVIKDSNLTRIEKDIFVLLVFLCKDKNECYCSNSLISEIFGISMKYASRLINSLKDKKYIEVKLVYKENSNEIKYRLIYITKKYEKNSSIPQVLDRYPTSDTLSLPQKWKLIKNTIKIIRKSSFLNL